MGELFTYDLLITIKRLSKLKIVVFYDTTSRRVVKRLFIVLNGSSSVNYHGNQSMIASHQSRPYVCVHMYLLGRCMLCWLYYIFWLKSAATVGLLIRERNHV